MKHALKEVLVDVKNTEKGDSGWVKYEDFSGMTLEDFQYIVSGLKSISTEGIISVDVQTESNTGNNYGTLIHYIRLK